MEQSPLELLDHNLPASLFPFHASVLDADIEGVSPYHSSTEAVDEVMDIKNAIEEELEHGN